MERVLNDLVALFTAKWPVANPDFLIEDTVTIALQLNGKLRGTLDIAKDMPANEAEQLALSHDLVKNALEGKTVRKIIVVPNRIINVVAA